MRRTLWTLGVPVVAVMAFAIFEPVQVLPRIRLSPGFAMTDQSALASDLKALTLTFESGVAIDLDVEVEDR